MKKPKETKTLYGKFQCPHCGNAQCKEIYEMASTDFAGQLADGTKFTKIVRHRVECSSCLKPSVLFQHEFDPEEWKG